MADLWCINFTTKDQNKMIKLLSHRGNLSLADSAPNKTEGHKHKLKSKPQTVREKTKTALKSFTNVLRCSCWRYEF